MLLCTWLKRVDLLLWLVQVSDQIKNNGASNLLIIVADVTTDAERIISKTVNNLGRLNVMINNAGILKRNSIENIDFNDNDHLLNTNVHSVIDLSK